MLFFPIKKKKIVRVFKSVIRREWLSKINLKGKVYKESRENLVQWYLQQYLMLNRGFGWQDLWGMQHCRYTNRLEGGILVRPQSCVVASKTCDWVSAGRTRASLSLWLSWSQLAIWKPRVWRRIPSGHSPFPRCRMANSLSCLVSGLFRVWKQLAGPICLCYWHSLHCKFMVLRGSPCHFWPLRGDHAGALQETSVLPYCQDKVGLEGQSRKAGWQAVHFCGLASTLVKTSHLAFKIQVWATKEGLSGWQALKLCGILHGETEPERNSNCQVDTTVDVCLNGLQGSKKQKKIHVLSIHSEAWSLAK